MEEEDHQLYQRNKQGRVEEEDHQLYQRPEMTGQARDEEEEEDICTNTGNQTLRVANAAIIQGELGVNRFDAS